MLCVVMQEGVLDRPNVLEPAEGGGDHREQLAAPVRASPAQSQIQET